MPGRPPNLNPPGTFLPTPLPLPAPGAFGLISCERPNPAPPAIAKSLKLFLFLFGVFDFVFVFVFEGVLVGGVLVGGGVIQSVYTKANEIPDIHVSKILKLYGHPFFKTSLTSCPSTSIIALE